MNTNPCRDQAHGSCLSVIHLVAMGQGKARYLQWNVLEMIFCWVGSTSENVDLRLREGEGVEGANCHQIWMSLLAQGSVAGRFLGWVS